MEKLHRGEINSTQEKPPLPDQVQASSKLGPCARVNYSLGVLQS